MTTGPINPQTVVCWSGSAVATEVNGEVVLMNLDRDRCYGLGVTGSEIWRRLREPTQVSELLTELEAAYEAAPGVIQADVVRTLEQLASEGLIQTSSPTDLASGV